jgi:cytoskeletal protein CcmA (bactofilin family)
MLKMKGFAAEDLNGFLDEGTEFSGELRFRDVLRVDGRVKGRIVSDNTLIIGETGQVDAEIDCGVVSIRGRVTGQVHGRQRIELLSGCRVLATLVSPKLLIEDGAFFQGDCRMGGPPKAVRPRMVLCIPGRKACARAFRGATRACAATARAGRGPALL